MEDYEHCIITEEDGNVFYNRYFHQPQGKLCKMLESRYGENSIAAIYPSGMCSIDSVFQILMMKNGWGKTNIVYGSELYCDTPRTIKYLDSKYCPINMFKIINEDDSSVMETFISKIDKSDFTIMFIEGCSNPNGNIFNFELLSEIKKLYTKKDNLYIVVDNTWITSAVFNPLIYPEVDVVVNSLTKYYGGDKSGIMGASITRNQEIGKELLDYCKIKGLHVCPLYCEEACKNIKLMDERISKTSKITQKLAYYLEEVKGLEVNHPKIKSHISYLRAIKYYGELGPSVLTFKINLTKTEALEWMRSFKFSCSTSFGASDSRFDQWPKSKKKNTWCRFAVGYDDNLKNITDEFDKMLLKLK